MRSTAVDGFELCYDRVGQGPGVVLLHGWPGDRIDYRDVVPLLADSAEVVVPDLRGFGDSDKHDADPAQQYSAAAQARSVAGLIEELGLRRPVVAGYDVGSRVAQALAAARPELVGALVLAPPLPGVGQRILGAHAQREFWYQAFHQLPLAEQLIDGEPQAVRDYLTHFWTHWSGPQYELDPAHLDHLVAVYGPPGAFTASIAWYRAGAGTVARSMAEVAPQRRQRVSVPTTVLWPEHDPLFPRTWSDRLGEFFSDTDIRFIDGVGHFLPMESPRLFAAAVTAARDRRSVAR
ncbi:alpha/beta fold hydrolase [Saccharopolyspora sp. 5N708]|uniref:alpha/beta fold hydrolase n=1 Tax=Saccharopolyspora sp. 5N708 TaxID=3457424 RepID=UPI003FD13A32